MITCMCVAELSPWLQEHKPVQVADASTYQMSSSNHVTLSQCIELLTEPETLSGEDTW